MNDYAAFLASKRRVYTGDGITDATLPEQLYAWQAAITRWALRKGRAAIFADCGLGKTYMQLAWARAVVTQTWKRVLILAPLCVAEQTVDEAAAMGLSIRYAPDQPAAGSAPIVITNYERLDKFDPSAFGGVVLDESSILKAFDGKTRTRLIEAFAGTRFRLCCTATPSPNDVTELANHAEFLGLMTRAEFLATWFVKDESDQAGWRMKRHGVDPFYRWLASWAVALRSPADIGGDATGYALPPLRIHDEIIEHDGPLGGALFPEMAVRGLQGRLAARRDTLAARVARTIELAQRDGQWLIWCGLNAESEAVAAAAPGALEVTGTDSHAAKVDAIRAFVRGDVRTLVSKSAILGFGMNFQHCHQMAFVGLNDSYESYYQCIRRAWRYGQAHPVDVHIVVSEAERSIVDNVRRKEAAADELSARLLAQMREFTRAEVAA
jgi:hypothetical protein